jgi:hypothetical protein
MLSFMAEHRMVLDHQIAVLLDQPLAAVDRRLDALQQTAYLTSERVFQRTRFCRIRKRGLEVVGSALRAPQDTPGAYRHDAGVAWLWLLAHRGRFGPLAEVIGERRLRSEDVAAPGRPYSIRLGGYDSKGKPNRHYPDLLLVDPQGRRVALELELSTKEVPRREAILAGYGAERRLEGVVYFVERAPVGRAIKASAAAVGVSDFVHVRNVPPLRNDGTPRVQARPARGDRRRLPERAARAGAAR